MTLTGATFGRWTVVEPFATTSGKRRWLAQCECGTRRSVLEDNLVRGLTTSCGCRPLPEVPLGSVFGLLTTVSTVRRIRYRRDPRSYVVVDVRCVCGLIRTRVLNQIKASVRGGKAPSCGCAGKQLIDLRSPRNRLYRIWCGMRARCYDTNNKNYYRYGGRGIAICQSWLRDFDNFRIWALSNNYDEQLSIDRIDVDGNYEPANCRWADKKTQCRNRGNNHHVTAFGETKTIADWIDDPRSCGDLVRTRIAANWPAEIAITAPAGSRLKDLVGADG